MDADLEPADNGSSGDEGSEMDVNEYESQDSEDDLSNKDIKDEQYCDKESVLSSGDSSPSKNENFLSEEEDNVEREMEGEIDDENNNGDNNIQDHDVNDSSRSMDSQDSIIEKESLSADVEMVEHHESDEDTLNDGEIPGNNDNPVAVNSEAVQSINHDDNPGMLQLVKSTNNISSKGMLSNDMRSSPDCIQNVEDQAELDFEEEVNEERKDEAENLDDVEKLKDDDEKENDKENEEANEKQEDGEDDGEVEDDDDLEEGEVKDTATSRKPQPRPVCRFFNKGQCTWGSSCRFIHPGVNDKGNYNMFGPSKPLVPSNGPGMLGHPGMAPGPPRVLPPFGRGPPDVILPPPPAEEGPPVESAWERGLRHAKEILKKANKRKEMEPDFEEKRFNLTLGASDANLDYEKENDFYPRSPYRKNSDPLHTFGYDDPSDPFERQAQEFWRGGNYENFEVRYLRTDYEARDKEKPKERSRREKYERARNQDRNWRENRFAEVQGSIRSRGDEWKDPWRRSTSPKRRGRSKSFSSASSGSSYSSGSSRSRSSSYSSFSRSSSATSYSSCSSRSYSRSRTRPSSRKSKNANVSSNVKKKQSAPPPPAPPPQATTPNQPPPPKVSRPPPEKKLPSPIPPQSIPLPPSNSETKKKKPPVEKVPPLPVKSKRPKSLSVSGSESGSSRSRSGSRSSYSGSSSRSSLSSRSTSRSSSVSSFSDKETKPNASRKKDKSKRSREKKKRTKSSIKKYPSDHNKEAEKKLEMHLDMKSSVNATRSSKDPLKQSGQKPQIKLTLLNKHPPEKQGQSISVRKDVSNLAKPKIVSSSEKEGKTLGKTQVTALVSTSSKLSKTMVIDKIDMKSTSSVKPVHSGNNDYLRQTKVPPPPPPSSNRKKASSPNSPTRSYASKAPTTGGIKAVPGGLSGSTSTSTATITAPAAAKKNTISRREELLKQLKAVEDAIARKRAKL